MRRAVLCAALVGGVMPLQAAAQSLNLTESEALARLSPESPRARAVRAGVDLARVDVLTAGRWPNPRVTYDRESVARVTENMAMVAQVLPITGRRGLEVQAASALVDASSSRADEEMRRLRADLRQAFAALVAAQTRERELATTRDRLRELSGILARREAAGEAAGFDRLRAEREAFDVETDIVVAATDRARARATLASFFADVVDPSLIVAVAASPPVPADLPPVEALLETAEATRGDLVALRHEIEAADLTARAARRRLVPEPEVVAGTKSSTAGGGDVGSVIAVHASIPLFDRARPERALAAARAARAQAQMDALRQVWRGQIGGLRAAVVERRRAADRYRTEAVSSAAEIERIAQVSYDAGERSILELLDAYRIGSTARTRQAALDAAVREAEIELEFTSGWEIK
jgi:cobalt-zinc-cadmium efflux system outer membrane protein